MRKRTPRSAIPRPERMRNHHEAHGPAGCVYDPSVGSASHHPPMGLPRVGRSDGLVWGALGLGVLVTAGPRPG